MHCSRHAQLHLTSPVAPAQSKRAWPENADSRAQIVTPIGSIRVFSAVVGRHNVPHMLAAVAVSLAAAHPTAMGDRNITLAVGSWLAGALALGSCMLSVVLALQPHP